MYMPVESGQPQVWVLAFCLALRQSLFFPLSSKLSDIAGLLFSLLPTSL